MAPDLTQGSATTNLGALRPLPASVPGRRATDTSPSRAQLIYQTIVDLGASNHVASRQVLMEATGLTYGVIDDHVKRMIEDGRIRRVVNGIFEAVPVVPEDRAVSITHLPGGGVKLEVGDFCIDLSMRETRMVSFATAGVALQFGRMHP